MRKLKKTLGILLCASVFLAGSNISNAQIIAKENSQIGKTVYKEKTKSRELVIDGSTRNKKKQNGFRGLGAVTCNNSSRLLMDYKEKNPDAYWEIMNWLFHPTKGAGISHVKIELGCDLDTSSGAEPATKRTSSEKANVRRGAGFMFAFDALSINPAISVDMLCWGMPRWVENAYKKSNKAGYKARFRWYKETMDAAYDQWGIKFSYVSANRNEKTLEKGWTIYLRKALNNVKSKRYDYGKVKIVAADETDTMEVASEMLKNKKYRKAVDVIGCHYNAYMNSKVKKLNKTYKKEVWYSEGASVATDSLFGRNNTVNKVDTSGENGMLDIANRIINGFSRSNMTMYEFQPAVAAYYDGSVYYPKQLISANHPWSGYYEITNGLIMSMHFTNFMKKGWQMVTSGSYGDGTQSNHCITKTKNNYLTEASPSTGDYSTVITNDSKTARTYTLKVSNLKKASSKVYVWETKSAGSLEAYDSHWLTQTQTLTPKKSGKQYTYNITVKPYSMVTVTTVAGRSSYEKRKTVTSVQKEEKNTSLSLPYKEDFQYSAAYLRRRGNTPAYTSDLNGAFEVAKLPNGNKVLQQKIDKDHVSTGWSGTAEKPLTSLGDDTWRDYMVSADVLLDKDESRKTYAGICGRYNTVPNTANNGYWLRIYSNGQWKLISNQGTLASGKDKSIARGKFVNLRLKLLTNTVTAYINGKQVAKKTVTKSCTNSGRVALCSSYDKNIFDNLQVSPVSGGVNSIRRIDDFNSNITFSGSYDRLQSQSYINYGRTISTLKKKKAAFTYTFSGTGVSFLGANISGPKVKITLDGKVVQKSYTVKDTEVRTVWYQVNNLKMGTHKIKVELLNQEELDLDAIEVLTKKYTAPKKVAAKTLTLEPAKTKISYGDQVNLKVITGDKEGAKDVTLTSSDPKVVAVLGNGTLYGNGAGTATITGKSADGKTASVKVTVTHLVIKPAAGIRVGAGEKIALKASFEKNINKAKIVKWISSDKTKGTVSSKGVVKTRKAGNVTITAIGANGYKGNVVVHILKAPYKVKAPKKISLKVHKKKKITYRLPAGSYATKVTFASSNKKVAAVTAKGVVKGKRAGKCTVVVKAYNGKKARIKVTVK